MSAGTGLGHDPDCQFQIWCSCGAYSRQQEALDALAAEVEQLRGENRKLDCEVKLERVIVKGATTEVEQLRERNQETEAYAKEGWDWLDEALAALGAKTVFDIKAAGREVEQLRGRDDWLRRQLTNCIADAEALSSVNLDPKGMRALIADLRDARAALSADR